MANRDSTRAPQRKKRVFRFTQESLNALPAPRKRTYLYDNKVTQLGLTHLPPTKNYPDGKKTFFARATVNGKTKRITIENGVYPGMAIETARDKAVDAIGAVAKGTDPIREKRAQKAAEVIAELTVEDAVTLFGQKKQRRVSATGEKLPLKQSTVASYKHSIKSLLGEDLYQGPLVNLTEDTITRRVHLGEKSGKTYTATGCRSLSAVWNWVGRQRDYRGQLPPNPVKQYALLNEGLHKAAPRQGRIEDYELPAWFDAVDSLPSEIADFYLWLLFTGNRFSEAKNLNWQDINWRGNEYQLRDPKNRIDVTLPLPSYLANRLRPRKQNSGLIFTFESDARHHRQKVCKAIGKNFTNHDLRRTFAGIAQDVCSYTALKRLMNHTYSDVTEAYAGRGKLGEAIDNVQREILRLAGRPLDNVVRLEAVR